MCRKNPYEQLTKSLRKLNVAYENACTKIRHVLKPLRRRLRIASETRRVAYEGRAVHTIAVLRFSAISLLIAWVLFGFPQLSLHLFGLLFFCVFPSFAYDRTCETLTKHRREFTNVIRHQSKGLHRIARRCAISL